MKTSTILTVLVFCFLAFSCKKSNVKPVIRHQYIISVSGEITNASCTDSNYNTIFINGSYSGGYLPGTINVSANGRGIICIEISELVSISPLKYNSVAEVSGNGNQSLSYQVY